MVRDYPDFVTELVRVAKQGRSLGVHLLFATQQPSLIKEGLTRNLTYWIALRVTGADDSKTMVTIPDAAYLTTETPGRGYFRVGKRVVPFQSARVTIPYQPPSRGSDLGHVDVTGRWRPVARQQRTLERVRELLAELLAGTWEGDSARHAALAERFVARYAALLGTTHGADLGWEASVHAAVAAIFARFAGDQAAPVAAGVASLDLLAAQLLQAVHNDAAHEQEITLISRAMCADPATGPRYASRRYPIWSEPLPGLLSLADLLAVVSEPEWLCAPIGLLDLPATAQQQPCVLDLAQRDGNLLVLGSAGAGKTTLVRALLLALAATHSPADLWIYAIDPGGFGCGLAPGAAADARWLPHIADTIAPQQTAKVERLLIELQDQIEQRLALIQRHGADTLAQYRERAPRDAALPPAIVVAIDNIAELAAAQPEAVETLRTLIRDGRKCGISFVVTAYSWQEATPIQSSFETRIALRLNDTADSDAVIGKSYAARISAEQPGRAFLRSSARPIELQIAMPVLRVSAAGADGRAFGDAGDGLQDAVALLRDRWHACQVGRPQPLRSLSTRVLLSDLLDHPVTEQLQLGTPIGVEGMTLQPVLLDFAGHTPHLLIAGGPRSGKAELLRTIITGLVARHGPDDLQLVLVDYRRRILAHFADLPHVRSIPVPAAGAVAARETRIASSEPEVRALVADLAPTLAQRQLSGAQGPKIVLVISNWDLLQDTYTAWKPLAIYVLQGRDLGFHLLVTGAEYGAFASTDMLKMARMERCAIHLGQPAENSTVATTIGVKLPRQAAHADLPPGRGYVSFVGKVHLTQFALSTPAETPAAVPAPPEFALFDHEDTHP